MSSTRRVRSLHITGTHEHLLRRAVPLVEDALNTASLPPTPPGRLLVIRRLDLGAIELDKPSQSLALRIEEVIRGLSMMAIDAEQPAAATAQAVFFREPSEARAALIVRLLRGPPPTEWFWKSAVRTWSPGRADPEAIAALLAPPPMPRPDEPAPAVFVARLVESLLVRGVLPELLQRVPAARLPWPGTPPPSPRATPAPAPTLTPAPPAPAPRVAPRWIPPLRELVATRGPEDPVVHWLAAVALVASRPERASAGAQLHASVQALLAPARARRAGPPPEPSRARPPAPVASEAPSPQAPPPLPPEAPTPAPRPTVELKEEAPLPLTAPQPSPANTPPQPSPPYVPTPARWPDEEDWPDPQLGWAGLPELLGEPKVTEASGLFFVITLMERLRLPALLQEEPALLEQGLPWRILTEVLDNCGVAPEDPMRQVAWTDAEPPGLEPFEAPASHRALLDTAEPLWSSPPPRPLLFTNDGLVLRRGRLGPEPPNTSAPSEDAYRRARAVGWRAALSRRLARDAELTLPALVRRWGWVAATPTHIDLVLPLGGLDMTVRRAALDITPGWVPWLGRVVTVHYVEDELMGLPPRTPAWQG